MCGIAGWVSDSIKPSDEQLSSFDSALQKLSPRGPDFQAHQSGTGWILGHTRLSIIDLSASSNQPMTDGNGNFIVFNGEIYNYLELKKKLQQQGVSFTTHGDTEVLLKGLIHAGSKFIEELRGMFAFAFLNTTKKQLLLCRDRLGVKPLAYSINRAGIQFASDLFCLKRLGHNLSIDEESASLFLMLGYVPSTGSIYQQIKKIKPATYVQFQLRDDYSIATQQECCYWDIGNIAPASPVSKYKSYEAALDEYNSLVTASVRYRLVSDVEVGSLLSGGIDSTLVSLKAAELTDRNITCFTTGFDDLRYDEIPFAKPIAERLQVRHATDYLTEDNVLGVWKDIWKVYDEPFADSSALPMISLCANVRKYFKVALSGDGGDEINAGYAWHKALYKLNNFPFTIPKFAVSAAIAFSGNTFFKYRVKALGLKDRIDQWMYLKTGLVPDEFRNLPLARDNAYALLRNYFEQQANSLRNITNVLDWAMRLDMLTYLPDDLLVKADRASMSAGLELREPLLDHKLVEFGLSCPVEYRMNLKSLQSKKMSKDILYQTFSPHLIDRNKQGFSPPLDRWLQQALKKEVTETICQLENNQLGIYRTPSQYQTWDSFSNSIHDKHNQYLWRLICFNSWKENN